MCDFSLLSEARDFNALEEIIVRLVERLVIRFLGAYLRHLDTKLMRERPPGLRHVGVKTRRLTTRFGDITILRRCYVEQESGRYRYLLDESLGLACRERFTRGLKARAVDEASRQSFRRSAAALGGKASHSSVHNWTWQVGAAFRREVEHRRRQVFGLGRAVEGLARRVAAAFCEADGVVIRLQRAAGKVIEAKLAIIHEGWERLHPSSREYRLKGKLVYASLQGPSPFWESLSVLAGRRWDLSAVKVIAGDGAEWVKQGVGYFPGAVYQLCRFHLARKIRECLGGLGPAFGRVWAARSDPERLIESATEAAARAADPEAKERARELLGYLVANRDGLADYRTRVDIPGVELRGLGAVESNIDKLVSARMRKRGMSWTVEGAANMLAVLTLRVNGWLDAAIDAVWGSSRTAEPTPRRPAAPRPGSQPGLMPIHMPALDRTRPVTKALRALTEVAWPF
ncbi:ISLre2 family transposase [Alicyclobacillus sp.]|uniref:ISLre2 family transposase n=1 Tax=Alicyclobacillus sp. TaxID=61169 RepID=UPI0025BA7650|nr:ISLre2 family transposase [Alicyclobacillus sp.]MCL6517299.1 ISLre2 family transposase [Alicyclobacillus sp.]